MRAQDRVLAANRAARYRAKLQRALQRLQARQLEAWTAQRSLLVLHLEQRCGVLQEGFGKAQRESESARRLRGQENAELAAKHAKQQQQAEQRFRAALAPVHVANAAPMQKTAAQLARYTHVRAAERVKAHRMTDALEREAEAERQWQLLLGEESERQLQRGVERCVHVEGRKLPYTLVKHRRDGGDVMHTAVLQERARAEAQREERQAAAERCAAAAEQRAGGVLTLLQTRRLDAELDRQAEHAQRVQRSEREERLAEQRAAEGAVWRTRQRSERLHAAFEAEFPLPLKQPAPRAQQPSAAAAWRCASDARDSGSATLSSPLPAGFFARGSEAGNEATGSALADSAEQELWLELRQMREDLGMVRPGW